MLTNIIMGYDMTYYFQIFSNNIWSTITKEHFSGSYSNFDYHYLQGNYRKFTFISSDDDYYWCYITFDQLIEEYNNNINKTSKLIEIKNMIDEYLQDNHKIDLLKQIKKIINDMKHIDDNCLEELLYYKDVCLELKNNNTCEDVRILIKFCF